MSGNKVDLNEDEKQQMSMFILNVNPAVDESVDRRNYAVQQLNNNKEERINLFMVLWNGSHVPAIVERGFIARASLY